MRKEKYPQFQKLQFLQDLALLPLKKYHKEFALLKDGSHTAHASEIIALIETQAYSDPAKIFHPPRASEIFPLEFVVSSIQNVKTAWTEGKLTFLPGQQKIWFEACEKCLTPLDVDTSWKIMCSYCKEFTNMAVRFDMGVFLSHGTTVIPATIKSPEIDKLLPYTSNENNPLTDQVEAALEKKHVICFLKYYDREYRGMMQRRYPMLKIYPDAELHEYNSAQQAATLAASISEDLTILEHIGSSSSTPKDVVEKEFLTSKMKEVLEEVAAVPALAGSQGDEQPTAKRILPFGQDEIGKAVGSSTNKIPESLSSTSAPVPAPEEQSDDPAYTTSKKSKTKDK